ncbi:MAG: Uridylate kinase [Chlamydiales bacterium]|nr:Uridylate kinase [Chlamydiales bacterium]
MPPYRRVLLKISGEALMGDLPFGASQEAAANVAANIKELQQNGVEVGVVIGGGNIFRGIQQSDAWGMERTPADHVGMLATLINGTVLSQALSRAGCEVRVLSALDCPTVAEKYQWDKAMRYLKKGYIVLFVGGTGHPYFTTDTTSALRACEIHADILLKATTHVDGIYDKDPRKEPAAKKYTSITYQEVLEQGLGILDLSAITLCMSANIPIRVFNFYENSLLKTLSDQTVGTLVT